MRLIFCLDDDNGMMFFGKRQSQDRVLREWILKHTEGKRLFMSSYSARQFAGSDGYIVEDDYMSVAGEDDYCFVENIESSLCSANEVILCKWNRRYPSDKFFKFDLKACGFKKSSEIDIKGYSHDKITIEIYERNLK